MEDPCGGTGPGLRDDGVEGDGGGMSLWEQNLGSGAAQRAGGSLTCSDWCGLPGSSRSRLELEGRAAHGEEDEVGGLGQWNGSWGTESRGQGSSASMGQLLRR